MQARQIERRYLALIRGRLAAPTGTIEAPVGRHPVRRQLMAVVAGGRDAVTHYEEVEVGDDVSLLEVRLETGRTHQIRVHLSHIGHPLIGDRVYGGGGDVPKKLGLARFFLHSWRLAFPHPTTGETIEVADTLPADLRTALKRCGLQDPTA
jgi:23S rRNA pseudouridine1911/1915/1917 synthase